MGGNARRHELLEVLTIALTASICGTESCVDFALFAHDRRALFEEFLDLKGGLPSHDAFSRLFRLLDPVAFARCFQQFLGNLGKDGAGVLAIDGKTLRRSFDKAAGRSALHVVTAFAAGARMVVGQWAASRGPVHVTTDADHGRIEVRRHWTSPDVAWLASDRRFPDEATLPGLKTLGLIERTVTGPDQRTTTTRTLYLSSARLDPKALARAVRGHWSIEAAVHWVLDTSFDEDRARNRKGHGPENLAILRKLALNVVRAAKNDDSIRARRKRTGWSDDYARSILGQMR